MRKVQGRRAAMWNLSACVAALVLAAPAAAQQAAVEEASGEEEVIVVTGSRIARKDTIAAAPVLTVGQEDLIASGEVDISTFLREIPALQGSVSANFTAFDNGVNVDSNLGAGVLDLRQLGLQRTLVLVNGRRHVPGLAGLAAVDTTSIPTSLIDRVETLTGGASSIYGADAVTGAVNFVLRDGKSFDGLEYRVQGGISGRADAQDLTASLANGWEFAKGRGDVTFAAEYARTSAVFAGDRPFSGTGFSGFAPVNDAIATALGINPAASNTFVSNLTLPISSALGVIAILDAEANAADIEDSFPLGIIGDSGEIPTIGAGGIPQLQVVDGGVLRQFNPSDIFIDLFNGQGGDAVPTTPDVELILPSSNRFNFATNVNYSFSNKLNFFAEGKVSFSDTRDSIDVNGFNDDIPISLDNPFIPAALRAQLDSLIAEGIDPVLQVARDNLDAITVPTVNAERLNWRIVTGLQGEVLPGVNYEVSYNFGRTAINVDEGNIRLEDRFFAAVDAVINPATGQPVCRSTLDPTAEPPLADVPGSLPGFLTFTPGAGSACVPTSIFGADAINAAAADFIFVNGTERTVLTQEVVLATVAGDSSSWFSLPGGPVGFALGFEHRQERSAFTPDEFELALTSFNSVNTASSPASGEFSVTEGFLEVNLPIVADLPLIDLFEFTGSARFSGYTTIGFASAWTIGGRYRPHPWLTLRGTFANSVRAPNIGELFSPAQPVMLGADDDPCNPQFIDAGSEFREANCLALVGPNFNSTDFNTFFVSGLSGGNPDLQEEQGVTITAGFVFEPKGFLSGLTVVADFYDIRIDGAIDDLTGFDIAQFCVDLPSLDNQFCPQIIRDPVDGNITFFSSGQINLAALEARGVDWQVRYLFDVPTGGAATLGQLELSASGTRFLRRLDFLDPTQPDEFEDQLGTFATPRWIINFNADWSLDQLSLGWTGRFESNQLLPGIGNDDITNDPLFSDPFSTGGAFVHDFRLGYEFNDRLSISAGVVNALDRDPFLGSLNRPAGPRGRYFFLGLRGTL